MEGEYEHTKTRNANEFGAVLRASDRGFVVFVACTARRIPRASVVWADVKKGCRGTRGHNKLPMARD